MELFDNFRKNALCRLSCCILCVDNEVLPCVKFQQHSVTALAKLASQQASIIFLRLLIFFLQHIVSLQGNVCVESDK